MDVRDALYKLRQYVEGTDYAGYDPYDALNSPILHTLSFGQKYGRIAWVQLLRRLPVNLRPILGVEKGHNPKGIGLFLWGYAKLFKKTNDSIYLERIGQLLNLLSSLKSNGYSGNCWGYNFDWQSRAFFIPKWTPTIVNSSFIGHALLDTYSITGEKRALDLALPIKDFLLNDLNRSSDGEKFCFSYTPIDTIAVHNANLLGASLLIRLYHISHEPELRNAALASLAYTMGRQRADGSWFYAETKMQSWIDSFHTGFNLQSIRYFLRLGEGLENKLGYEKGVQYYAENFFLDDGTPKYYHDRVYPIDIHAPSQALAFFSGEGTSYRILTKRICSWMLENMYDASGYVYFRKGRFLTNKIAYMRWSQAWAFHALTEFDLHYR